MTQTETGSRTLTASRFRLSKGLLTMAISLAVLFALSATLAPSSVSVNVVSSWLQFSAILAIIGLGQMLVVQQGGIDLSVPGAVSLAIVVSSQVPNGEDSGIPLAIVFGLAYAVGAGLLNAFLVGFLKLNAIIATLGTNALLFGAVLMVSGGIPRLSTDLLQSLAGGDTFGIPNSMYVAIVIVLVVAVMTKKTVVGRRFEMVGANPSAGKAMGLRVRTHDGLSYVWAQILYWVAGFLLAGITAQPTAYMGNNYLLPSVAVVVLGGTSLLGGRGFPFATFVAALFLGQLDQFVLALGVPYSVRTLVQAAALAIGVAIYTVNWRAVRAWITSLFGGNRKTAPAVS